MTYCERCGFEKASLGGFHRVKCEEALAYELDELDAWLKDFEAQPGASEIPTWRAALAAVRRNRLFLAAKLEAAENPLNVEHEALNAQLAITAARRSGLAAIHRPDRETLADYYSKSDARRFMGNRG